MDAWNRTRDKTGVVTCKGIFEWLHAKEKEDERKLFLGGRMPKPKGGPNLIYFLFEAKKIIFLR